MTRREFISLATEQICLKIVAELNIPVECLMGNRQYTTSYGTIIQCLSENVAKTLRLNAFRITQRYKQQYSSMKYFTVDVIIEPPSKNKEFRIDWGNFSTTTCRPSCECMVEVKMNKIAKAEEIVACCKLEGLI